MKWKLVNESKTPANDDSINSALNGDVSEGTDDYDEEVEVIRHQRGVIKAERVGKNAIRIVVS
jgi:hypothetical protein